MRQRLRWGLAAGALAVVAAVTPPGPAGWVDDNQEIVIGALNIEHLGNRKARKGSGKNVAQKSSDIAEYVAASKVDVLVLEEIYDTDQDAQTRTNNTLDMAIQELNEDGGKWAYQLFPQRDETITAQLVGIVWNAKRVQPAAAGDVPNPLRLPIKVPANAPPPADPESPYLERGLAAMKFTAGPGKTDVVIIPIHLKSNSGPPNPVTRAQREVEARMIVAALTEVRQKFQDDDIVIIGDSNMKSADEPAGAAFAEAGFADQNSEDQPTYLRSAPFDRAFTPKEGPKTKEFVDTEFDVFEHPDFSWQLYRKRLSDHQMIRVTVRVMADDDGQ